MTLVCSYGLGRTGPQFALEDTDADDKGGSLLAVLSDPTLSFMKALSLFKVKALYGNIYNDLQVPCCTSLIIPRNPFRSSLANKPIEFHPKYPHVAIIDDKHYYPTETHMIAELIVDGRFQIDAVSKPNIFVGNHKKDMLITMFNNLDKLQWNRHPVYFSIPGAAHDLIMGKFASWYIGGTDVVQHAIDTYLEPFHI
jgi:hypothetical protein